MTKKEKDAIIAKGKEEAAAKAKAEEEAKANADTEEDTEDEPLEEDESEESEEDEADEEEIDYEEIARLESERAEKAEKALSDKAFKDRESRRKGKDDKSKDQDEDDDEEKPLTRKELNSIREQDRLEFLKTSQDSRALDIARVNTSSEAEAKAAHLIWKNRVVPTGDLEQDVLFAIGGLNRKKFIAKQSELARSLKSKSNVSRNAAGSQKTGLTTKEAKVSSQDAQAIKGSGMVWDGVKRVYKKPLGNGKQFFYYDPKSKRRWKGQ